jgi:outer membrane receptor protein involved in Fe transport
MKSKKALLCALCASVVSLPAATTPTDDIVTLSEFEVTGTRSGDDYIATESTSGMRLAEAINNLPFSVDVITAEMVQDFQLYDDDELMSFAAGSTADMDGTNLEGGAYAGRVRGFLPLIVRDGFQYAMPATVSNVLQINIIRGPQSVFYGRAEPGGIVNKVTRKPNWRNSYYLSGTYGSEGHHNALLSATGPIIKGKFYYRAYFNWFSRNGYNGPIDFEESTRYFYGLSFLYKFRPTTSLYASIEYQPSHIIPSGRFSMLFDARTASDLGQLKITRGWQGLGEINTAYADNAYTDTDFYGLSLLFEHRLNNTWSHRTALQTYTKLIDAARWSNASILYLYEPVNDPASTSPTYSHIYSAKDIYTPTAWRNGTFNSYRYNGTFYERTPYYRDSTDNCVALQSEFLATFNASRSSHKLLAAADASYRKLDEKNWLYADNTTSHYRGAPSLGTLKKLTLGPGSSAPYANGTDLGIGVLGNDYYNSSLPSYHDHPEWYYLKQADKTTHLTAGAFVSYRGSYIRNHLNVMAAVRYDYYSDKLTDGLDNTYVKPNPANPIPNAYNSQPGASGSKPTWSAGFTYQIIGQKLLLYASAGTSYRPKATVDHGFNTFVPPQESTSAEFGFKGASSFGGNQFEYLVSLYDMELRNVAILNDSFSLARDGGAYENPEFFTSGKQHSSGVEARLSWRPAINGLVLIGTVGYCDNEVKDAPSDNEFFVNGKPSAGVAKWNASLVTRYKFPGFLRGLTLGLAGTWRDSVVGYYENSLYYGTVIPSQFLLQGFLSYEFKISQHHKHTLALNVKNILDENYYLRSGRPYYGRDLRLTYSINF